MGVFVATNEAGKIGAAMMVQCLAGSVGLAWPPVAEFDEFADALVVASCEWLRDRGVKICQAFSVSRDVKLAALERNGFAHVTSLLSFRREIAEESPTTSLIFEPHVPPFTGEFRSVLLATHHQTDDCPELYQNRTEGELIAGFDEPPEETSWYLAKFSSELIGVLMLTTGDNEGEAELAYLGVVPGYRGRGFGRQLVAYARAVAAHRGARALTVSVDIRNSAALKLYARHGFVQTTRREVWLAHF